MTRERLYAYAIKKEDGSIAILHKLDENSRFRNQYRIPVSRFEESIRSYGDHFCFVLGTRTRPEHVLIDISGLVDNGIIDGNKLFLLDFSNDRRLMSGLPNRL